MCDRFLGGGSFWPSIREQPWKSQSWIGLKVSEKSKDGDILSKIYIKDSYKPLENRFYFIDDTETENNLSDYYGVANITRFDAVW